MSDTTANFTSRQRALSLAAIIAAAFGIGLSFGVGLPLTSLTFEKWGEPAWLIGLAGATPSFAILLALPLVPRLAARLGAVTSILAGCVMGGLGFLALYAFENAAVWIAIRFLMSAALALPWLVGETWMNTVSSEATRGRVIAMYAISFFLGFLAGPLLLDYSGISGPVAFIAGAAGAVLASIPILLAQRLAPPITHEDDIGVMAALPLAPVAMASAFLGGFAEMSYLSLIPNVGIAAGLDQSHALQMLSILTLGGIILQFPIGWLADKASRVGVTIGLSVLFIGLSLALPFVLPADIPSKAISFLLGGVILGFYTLGLVLIGERVELRYMTAANAAFLVMYQLGAISGPVLAGAAMTVSPVLGFIATVSTAMAIMTLAIVWLARREKH